MNTKTIKLSNILALWAAGGAAFAGPALSGQPKPVSVTLSDTRGGKVVVPSPQAKLTACIFITVDCPNANKYAPEITRIHDEYAAKGVAVYVVYSDPDVSAKAAKKHLMEFRHTSTGLLDPKHNLANAAKATKTPEAVLMNPAGKILYRGRIDNRHVEYGVTRPEPTRRDLRIALEEALAGKPISVPKTDLVGCYIPKG